jgi:hypothetical protein
MKLDFPLSASDVSLWLAVMAIILLITSEVLSSSTRYLGKIVMERKRLRAIGLMFGIGFMISVVIRIFQPT